MSLFKSLPQFNSNIMKRYQGELSDINLITSICGLKLAESKLNHNYLALYIFEAKTERSVDISAIIIAIRLSVSEAEANEVKSTKFTEVMRVFLSNFTIIIYGSVLLLIVYHNVIQYVSLFVNKQIYCIVLLM